MIQSLQVAVSPCPNDTFAFYHFFTDVKNHGKYESIFLDIEELNQGMIQSRWDIVKASFSLGLKQADYELLPSGSAIGFGVGPIAVYSESQTASTQGHDAESMTLEIRMADKIKGGKFTVGLPGEHTMANFLWDFYHSVNRDILPQSIEKRFMNFADIMKATEKGDLDMGILIHEGRFVYKKYDLKLYCDLGEFWQNQTGFPVPLGGIFIRKNLPQIVKDLVKKDLKESVVNALNEKKGSDKIYLQQIIPYVKKYSQELSQDVVEQHIDTYVTQETVTLSEVSLKAIEYLKKFLKGNI